MLVSWDWLSRYLPLQDISPAELADRLSLSGLNHEGTSTVAGQTVVDLEVTSNRGDCLGHLGVAREISVLYDLPLQTPDPRPAETGSNVSQFVRVTNRYTDACPRYTARVIHGVTVADSPGWLADALQAVGVAVVNNIVDVTNYVMLECGQPLHAFDLARLSGPEIVVRPARLGETLEAIDHRTYPLDPWMCMIADAQSPVAVAGVMGGAATEVTERTSDLLIEAAVFTPLSVRRTARRLKLHSPSSFRFERKVDPAGVDWASRRASELILQLAGGRLASGVIDTLPDVPPRPPIVLRLSQIERLLGIRVSRDEVSRILAQLGCQLDDPESTSERLRMTPPSWRHDLTREVDLIEEVARIHGYDQIPEDSPIAVAPSARRPFDAAMDTVRHVLTAAGISEAMTPSIVTDAVDGLLSPWTIRPALETETAMLEGARRLRRSLLPSLLSSRAANWAASGTHADLFEIAHTYQPGESPNDLPAEQYSLGIVTGDDFFRTKGILQSLVARLGVRQQITATPVTADGFDADLAIRLDLGQRVLGYIGTIDASLQASLKLPTPVTAVELALPPLVEACNLVAQFSPVSPFPSITRDLNFIVDEAVRWSAIEQTVRGAGGQQLTAVRYRETYRDPAKDGENRKRILLSVELQKTDATLTGGEADALVGNIIDRCQQQLGAKLLA